MATKAAAFHAWLEGAAGMPIYAAASVPEGAQMPYATYEWAEGAWGDGDVNVSVSLWFRTEGEAGPNAAVSKLGKSIGLSGVLLPCDGGGVWVKRGTPWAQSMLDEDPGVRRRYLNFSVEYLTSY